MRSGWYQVAFERDLKQDVTPLEAEKPLIAVHTPQGIRVFDAICPHRGAHLGFGGKLNGDSIVCPFHARRIGLGESAQCAYRATEYPTFTVSGLVFACLSSESDTGLPKLLRDLDRDHFFVAGFAMKVPVPAELIIENGFDATHFHPVHYLCEPPQIKVATPDDGEFRAAGTFLLPPRSQWRPTVEDAGVIPVPYQALAFSPGIILSHLGGEFPYWVLTAATPLAKRESIIRLSIAMPAGPNAKPPDESACEFVLQQSKKGLDKDLTIWQHMDHDRPARYAPEDHVVVEFRKYLNRFPAVP